MTPDDMTDRSPRDIAPIPEDPPSSLSDLIERVRAVSQRINERVRRVAPDDTQPDAPALGPDQPT